MVRAEPIGGGDDRTDKDIRFDGQILASTDRGSINTIPIGPASAWGTLYHTIESDPAEDEVHFDVAGVDTEGNETVLFEDITQETLDLSSIDPVQYPYVRLYLNILDTESATPAQLKRWLVTYEGEPEGIVSLQNEQNRNVQLQEGQPFNAQLKFVNISEYDFGGPITVRYLFRNQTTGDEQTGELEIEAVMAGEEVEFEVPITTQGSVGLNDLEVFVESRRSTGAVLQQQCVADSILSMK